MAENTKKTKELTSTQEGIIAGLVILFFGLLYWYLNPWQSEQKNTLALTEQTATGRTQGNGLASLSNEQPPTSTTASTPETRTTTATVESGIAPSTHTVNIASTTETTKTATFAKLPPPPGPVEANKSEIVISSSPTAVTTEANKAEPVTITPYQPATETKSVQVAANTTQTSEATTVSTVATPTEPVAPTHSAATTTPTTTSSTTTAVNKLELAPGSPEAKLQAYLDTKTLETPVGMDGISFEAKTSRLTKESDPKVLLLAALLTQYPEANFLITAYTTEIGTETKDSDGLSLMRAQTLGENLVKAGVDGKRITIMGMGKRPSPDKTSVASKQSQRIEISVIE